MSLKYTFLSEKAGMKGTRLQICNDEKRSVSVLQYKAQGCLLYSHEKGMYSENQKSQVKRQADLSTGEEIFILDLNGTDVAQNVFATLICADILNINCALIDETKSGKDIKESAAVYLEQIQKYLENNINKYEYVQSVLKTDDFVDYSGELDWFVYLEKLLQSLEKQKTEAEFLLKESANKEREFEQE